MKYSGLAELLGLVFITLKLLGVIDWSWLWVLAPFWLKYTFIFVLFAVAAASRVK